MIKVELPKLSPEVESCAVDCLNCHSVCLRTVNHCLFKGGKFADAEHIGLLLNCAHLCQTVENFLLGGDHEVSLQLCEIASVVCERCAKSCESFSDDMQLRACAEMCRSCAISCKRISPAQAA